VDIQVKPTKEIIVQKWQFCGKTCPTRTAIEDRADEGICRPQNILKSEFWHVSARPALQELR
ncbi:MAG: hypothetical protein ACE5D6_03805, partial [Candidatus Zixiibacteriota bacterium]